MIEIEQEGERKKEKIGAQVCIKEEEVMCRSYTVHPLQSPLKDFKNHLEYAVYFC